MFAGTANGGIYKIVSQAQDWALVSEGLAVSQAKTWIDDPALSRFSQLGSVADYLVGETDTTESGAFDPKAVLSAPVQALAVAPSANATLYAGTAGSGVYRTTNSGSSWQAVGSSGKTVMSLAVDKDNAARLWAGTNSSGVVSAEWGGDNNGVSGVRPRPGYLG